MPYSVPQTDTPFLSHVWQGGMYVGDVQQKVSIANWDTLVSSFSNANIATVGSTLKYVQGRQKVEVMVSFDVNKRLIQGGSIEIRFPNQFPAIY